MIFVLLLGQVALVTPCNFYFDFPGLFSNHGTLYFVATKRFFSKMGLACHIAKIHSEVSNNYSQIVAD